MRIFDERAFQAFDQADVEESLNHIRRYIQPILRKYGQLIHDRIVATGAFDQIPVHVAKHIRRKVSLPFNTWVSVGGDGRGYKKYGHVQLGINSQYVFLVLALIDHPPYESLILEEWQRQAPIIQALPEDFVFIFDHTDYPYIALSQVGVEDMVKRGQASDKQDSMLGRVILRQDFLQMDQTSFEAWLHDSLDHLMPLIIASRQIDLMQRKK